MKLCYITNVYPPFDRGGAERVVAHLAEDMAARGHEVHVITGVPRAHVATTVERGVLVHRVFHGNLFLTPHEKIPRIVRALWHVWSLTNPIFLSHVHTILQHERFDVVHTHNLAGTSHLIPRLLRAMHVAHVHTLHDVQLIEPSGEMAVGQKKFGLIAKLFQIKFRFLWKHVRYVTAPSTWLLQEYQRHGFFKEARLEKVLHIFNTSSENQHESPHTPTFLFVGQLEKTKGITMLAEEFIKLAQRFPARLIIVGTGSEEANLERMARTTHALQLRGAVPHADIMSVYAHASVLVVPSLICENSPNVIIEALRVGLPVAVSEAGGAPELVHATDGGWIVPADRAAWRAHVQWLLEHPDDIRRKHPRPLPSPCPEQFESLYALCANHISS